MKIQQNDSYFIQQRLKLSTMDIANICEKWNIKKLSLFGSILRDDFNPNSDIDILIQFNPSARQGLLTLARLKHNLEDITQRSVDIVVQESVENSENWIRKQEILNTAQIIYCQQNIKPVAKELETLPNEKLVLVSNFIDSIKQDQSIIQKEFSVNPLTNMKPYAYLANPSEPAISPDDWEMNKEFESTKY